MSVSQEIAAKQAAYAARPFAARVSTSHFSGTFRFDTMAEAIDYILQSFRTVQRRIATREFGNSWVAMDLRQSHVEGPDGRWPATHVLFVERLESN